MQKRGDDSKPLGICHRLFNFVLGRLVGFLPSGHPLPQVSTEVPVEYTNGGDKKGGSPTVTANVAQLQKGPEVVPVKGRRKELPPVGDIAISNGKSTSADRLQDKGSPPLIKSIPTGKAKNRPGKVRVPTEEGDMKARLWPSLTLVTDINEKSDDFIRQRKEAMQRSSTMGPKKL